MSLAPAEIADVREQRPDPAALTQMARSVLGFNQQLERMAEFDNQPPADWDGSFRLTSK